MKVLMVTDALRNGGAERQMALLASSLPEPWTAAVLSMEDGPYRPVLEALDLDVRITPRRFRADFTTALGMWRATYDIAPDVVHTWGWMSTMAMLPYCRIRRIPLVNGSIRRGGLPYRRGSIDRLSVRLSDTVVANSRAGLAAYGVAEGARGRVVYNGFDPSRLEHVTMSGDTSAREGTVAVMAARMLPEKDWRLLLESARTLTRMETGWTIVALGDGPDREPLMSEASDLVESGSVTFPEGGLEVIPRIASADIGVLLTDPKVHIEGCSNSIMEYMACGLPVVCTDSGGNREIVEDGVTGFVVPAYDAGAVVAAVRKLRNDPARSREMGHQGSRRLRECFTIERMVAGFVSAYESALAPRGPAGRRAAQRGPST